MDGMTTSQINAFTTLQQLWNRHQGLRSAGASLAELAESRAALDAARLNAHQAAS